MYANAHVRSTMGSDRHLTKGEAMTEPPGFAEFRKRMAEYDKRMEDPEYRARLERTAPFTEAEEQELYSLLDEALGDIDADATAAEQEQSGE